MATCVNVSVNNIFLVEISQLQCTEIYFFCLGWYPEKSWGAEEDKHRKEKVIIPLDNYYYTYIDQI